MCLFDCMVGRNLFAWMAFIVLNVCSPGCSVGSDVCYTCRFVRVVNGFTVL